MVPALRQAAGQFPPIGDLALLADREVAALVAPSGNVEWLCLPDMDSSSVFGALLDRSAGRFRVGPAEMLVPADQRYVVGSMVLETAWMTRSGLLVVRDALTISPWADEQRAPSQRRPPGDGRAEHLLLRTMKCVQGHVTLSCRLRADVRLWPTCGPLELRGSRLSHRESDRSRRRDDATPGQQPSPRIRGRPRGGARDVASVGACFRGPVLGRWRPARDDRRRLPPDRTHVRVLAPLGRQRPLPRPSLARASAPECADAQGADVRADRRYCCRAHHLTAACAGRLAQLGPPLYVRARLGLGTTCFVRTRFCVGSGRLSRLPRRGLTRKAAAAEPLPAQRRESTRGVPSSPTCAAMAEQFLCVSATRRSVTHSTTSAPR